MRIAQIAPLAVRVPPKTYGGTERIVSALTEELVARGHDVTLFASGDSVTKAKLRSVYPVGLREAGFEDRYGLNPWTLLHIGTAYDLQHDFDIIHDHTAPLSMPTAHLATTPVVATMHTRFTDEKLPLFQRLTRPHIVTLSQNHAQSAIAINHAGTVYNGLAIEQYPFSDTPEPYLLYVGSISMNKGTHFAAEAAEKLGMRLVIAAKLESADKEYFNTLVKPHLSDQIQWIGEVNEKERNGLMSKAFCFLHTITWREPFGLTMIEAMACGSPVIAFDQGSSAEIVRHGETGFVVKDVAGIVSAMADIPRIDRGHCREYALTNFNVKKMTDAYEALYKKIISTTGV